MSIQKECEVLQSGLSKAIILLAEARTNATRLSTCSVSEIEGEISYILDICHEGMSSIQGSMEQIELLQAMTGNIGQNSSENSSRGYKPQPKNLSDSQLAWLENTLDSITQFVAQTKNVGSGVLRDAVTTGKYLQFGLTMASILCSRGIATSTKLYDDVISPIIDISNSVVAPLTSKESGFSLIKKELDSANKFHLGEYAEEYEMLDVMKKKEEEETEMKRKLNINYSSKSSGNK